ncbi:PLP-dependent aminotransferase family protein [Xanthomonas euvesicatoria]|uniref:MocR-like pyridoxine biosynthesis transcription factor PdxR n=1 Tax=Xanthomonas euvesicatoria TaxID=456327 RepID=UPI001C48D487|nr:PLP-dependent aminotransferase family protein [Xanthomonas euvesicatoria]MBV6885454.1 PLP-dependent aminotransferase family protein [Xanthomonas campestris pv. euphorbiae]
MPSDLHISLDRTTSVSLSDQIRLSISKAIESGLLAPGTRLPSWLDLAAQLGVARGTVQLAYERLTDAQMIEASRSTGTRVCQRPRVNVARPETFPTGSFIETYQEMTAGPAIFRIGIPAWDGHPSKLFERIRSHSLKTELTAPALYPDPRGELELRREIAAYLAIARGIHCYPEQIIITTGFSGGLGLALRALRLEGRKAWIEDPGFLFTRKGLEVSGLKVVPVPVDDEGINVDRGIELSPDAALAVVTPGQQAPVGVTLSLNRRMQLLDWARSNDAWIIEDDYLSELQLVGRAAPALGSLDDANRVIHIGTFSKTVSPAMRLGFLVAPSELASAFTDVAATLAPAPWPALQLATAYFMREGHYLRHLRRIKRLYAVQRDALTAELNDRGARWTNAGLAILLRLPKGSQDVEIAHEAIAFGLAPSPLSRWYADTGYAQQGLLLGVATAPERHLAKSCRRLFEVIKRCSTNE